MSRKILTVVSEWGYWGEELVGPLDTFDAAGYETRIVTPKGKKPSALPPSMNGSYIDPPLGRTVVSREIARKTQNLQNSERLNAPINLSAWLPEYPYWSAPNYLRELEAYHHGLEEAQNDIAQYDALLIVGGSGAMLDLVNNNRLHQLILSFYRQERPIAAICYGVASLVFARDLNERESIIRGKHVTGHTKEDDYKDGTGFVGTELNMGPPPYALEYLLRDATGSHGGFHGNFGKSISVVVDYPFITGRTSSDSYATAEKLVDVLEHGLRRHGW
jgi:putative intracellular protease/amidase